MGKECCGQGCCEDKEGKENCCSGEEHEGCCEGSCNDDCGEMEMAKVMMGLANRAWGELMVDKMKKAYEKSSGAKMDKATEVAVEACMAFWNNKMRDKASWEAYEDKLKKAMM
ncbi:hypothetical protein HZB02_06920 [Candidatus Woesearchaeota archaeon]|nr:hypothetical protein [Candidatus Woesearchaeota archaeon]